MHAELPEKITISQLEIIFSIWSRKDFTSSFVISEFSEKKEAALAEDLTIITVHSLVSEYTGIIEWLIFSFFNSSLNNFPFTPPEKVSAIFGIPR